MEINDLLRSTIIRDFSNQITEYINSGKRPDKFVVAILSNNITAAWQACHIVDSRVITLEDIGEMLINIQSVVPPEQWGTTEKVEQYLGNPCTDKEKYRYECAYDRAGYDAGYTVFVNSLDVVKDGFWITKNGDYTNGDDCYEWIPPSKILIIRKL
jgi:hypothetical protein